MRVLVTIPHFHRPKAAAGHGSEGADAEARARVFRACLESLHRTLGPEQGHMSTPGRRSNGRLAGALDVVVCTTGGAHLLDRIPAHLCRHEPTDAEPRLLGYACHAVLARGLGAYDAYAFLEDDLRLDDPLFLTKVAWFRDAAGEGSVLQPNRYETAPEGPIRKLYIDCPLVDPAISARFQDRSEAPTLRGRVMGREIAFERPDNPHSGCFFLGAAQMRAWSERPWFLDRADGFWGPLESAATLGLMRTFRVYKPAPENAGFLEIEHLDRRYLGSRVRPPPGYRLA